MSIISLSLPGRRRAGTGQAQRLQDEVCDLLRAIEIQDRNRGVIGQGGIGGDGKHRGIVRIEQRLAQAGPVQLYLGKPLVLETLYDDQVQFGLVEPRQQLGECVRFRQIIVAAGFQPLDPVVDLVEGAEKQHRRIAAVRPQPFDDTQAVERRQHPVDHGDVEIFRRCQHQPVAAVGGMHRLVPGLLQAHRLYAYDYSDNKVPGTKFYEEPAYWRDVGTIEAYFNAHRDVLGVKPRFDIYNPRWPIYSETYQGPVAKIIDGQMKISRNVFVNINNHYEGCAVLTAERLCKMIE